MSETGSTFDRLAKTLGARRNRRVTMAQLGGAGLAVALGATSVHRVAADDAPATCTQTLRGQIATGEFAGVIFEGTLAFSLQNGRIDDGTFTVTAANASSLPGLTVGLTYPLVGSAFGRALHLRITAENGSFLSLEGTGQEELVNCGGDMSGTFGGPYEGTLGTWITLVTAQPPSATVAPVLPTTPPEPEPSQPEPEPTMTTCDPEPDCGVTLVLDKDTCTCVCPGNNIPCGSVCCPGGSVCTDEASGTCSCPDGYEICIDLCVESCPSGQMLNDACECVAA